jgi:hypothetical protein
MTNSMCSTSCGIGRSTDMTRLTARYKHFWATGKYYQRFWQNSGDAQAQGTTFTVTSSLVAGLQQADVNVAGITLTTTLSLLDGFTTITEPGQSQTVTSTIDAGIAYVDMFNDGVTLDVALFFNPGEFGRVDVVAPLNTRLNARYRHFQPRRVAYKHLWQTWEGAGIGPALADGDLIVSSLALLESGVVTADANIDGVTFTIDLELDQGPTSIVTPGQMTVVSAVVNSGVATADANVYGQVLPVTVELIQGFARFDTITIPVTITGGTVFVPPDALAIPEPLDAIDVTLFAGVAGNDSVAPGADQEIVVELIAGEASARVDNEGDTLTVDVSLDQAQSSSDAFISGDAFEVRVRLEPGVPTTEALSGDTLTVSTSIIEGVATGEDNSEPPSQSARAGGPVGYQKAKEQVSIDAQAFGAFFQLGTGIVSGKPHVDPVVIAPQPTPNVSPTHMQPVDVAVYADTPRLPESLTKLLEVSREPVSVLPELPAVQAEPVEVRTNWVEYDNALFELEIL